MMVLYGLGTTIGAGIYALTGAVAGRAGLAAPVSFLLAALLASFTALSFAELTSRHPRSAGEAVYVREGLGSVRLAAAVGLIVALSGCVSAATIANGFAGYLGELIGILPRSVAILAFTLLLGLVAIWGIRQSAWLAGAITVVEVTGLVVVLFVARDGLGSLPDRLPDLSRALAPGAWTGIFAATVLAFYAFLGFEDMVNVAEEVKDVRRKLPRAIVWVLVLTTALYGAVSLAAVTTVAPAELGGSEAPLSLVYERATGRPATFVSLISVAAMVNGALIQVVMASRVLYGLATEGRLPGALGWISPRTRTPVVATALVTAVLVGLALWLPLASLAEITSVLTLSVFTLVNLALVRLKRRGSKGADAGIFRTPRAVPILGFTASAGVLVLEGVHRLAP